MIAVAVLRTWAGKSTFSYTGSVKNGTKITYGNYHTTKVNGKQYNDLLDHFQGKTVPAGTSRTDPPKGSVGEWLQANVTKVAISSYVCPILITEGYAEKVGSQTRFFER